MEMLQLPKQTDKQAHIHTTGESQTHLLMDNIDLNKSMAFWLVRMKGLRNERIA